MDPYDVFSRPAEVPDAVLRYADHDDGLIDVFFPPSLGRPAAPTRLIVFVHGGFWRQEWDRRHARPLAADLIRRGYVVAVPEYRRTGGLGGWPSAAEDVLAALARAPGLIDEVAPGRIGPGSPVVVMGHSAGGHLALWAGIRAGRERVSRIVALAPVTDLAEAARRNLDDGAVQDLLGGSPSEQPDRYAEAEPLSALGQDSPDVVIVHGSADAQVPIDLSRASAAASGPVDYRELEGVDHFALIDPLSAAWPEVLAVVPPHHIP